MEAYGADSIDTTTTTSGTDAEDVLGVASSNTSPASSSTFSWQVDQDAVAWENAHILPEEYYTSSSPYFKLDDETPSLSHTRRSLAAQRRYQDPVWKARWYERRWGEHQRANNINNNSTQLQRRQWKAHEERLRSPRMERFLSHPALVALSEVEIAHAIRTYVVANRRRSKAAAVRRHLRQQQQQQQKQQQQWSPAHPDDDDKLPRDALWHKFNAVTLLEEQREQRAERARKAYATRLANIRTPPSRGASASGCAATASRSSRAAPSRYGCRSRTSRCRQRAGGDGRRPRRPRRRGTSPASP